MYSSTEESFLERPIVAEKLNRHKIIEKATQLFTEHGYNRTSMDAIAKACHIKKASIYHHIPSRKFLVVEVLTRAVANFKADHFNFIYDDRHSPMKRLKMHLQAIEDFFIHSKGHCLFNVLMLESANEIPEVMPLVKNYFIAWASALEHLLNTHYDKEKSKALAQNAVSQLQGAIILGGLFQDPQILKLAIQQIAELLPEE